MGTRRSIQPGPTGQRVQANLSELRDLRRISLRALADRLERLGHPVLASGLSKIELGDRRADVDDLMALAIALDVAPNRLLLTGKASDEKISLTPEAEANQRTAWRWATGDAALPVDLWTDNPGTIDLNRARPFRNENRPQDPPGTTLEELGKHQEALAPAITACREAIERSGLQREAVLNSIDAILQLSELGEALIERNKRNE
jgi:transcriptional regulator with XRE-family HTH domain